MASHVEDVTSRPPTKVLDYNMADVFNTNSCTYCQEGINGLRVQCCVCDKFILCLQCFSAGAEIGPHKNDHSYKFVLQDSNIMVKGPGNWSAREELRLLQAVEVVGFGNWEEVSEYIESRSPEELKEEYISRYVDGAIGKATWPGIQRPQFVEDVGTARTSEQRAASRLLPLDIKPDEARSLGYMPKRDDFDREYNTDTEAEKLVSSLFGGPSKNDDLETALKLAQVDMYMRRLKERARRKRVVRDYQLVAKFFASSRKDSIKPAITKEQREFRERMRVFSQFITGAEHERLVSGIERAQELRLRLSELARYRQAGLTHADECAHYEQHLAWERKAASAAATPASSSHQQWKHAKSGSSGSGLYFQETQSTERRDDADDSNFTIPRSTWRTDDICTSDQEKSSTGLVLQHPSQHRPPSRASPSPSLDPARLPGGKLLSQKEIQLCSSLNLRPNQYITLKTVILRDHLAPDSVSGNNTVTASVGPTSPGWDLDSVNAVTKYLVSSGWL